MKDNVRIYAIICMYGKVVKFNFSISLFLFRHRKRLSLILITNDIYKLHPNFYNNVIFYCLR